MFGAKTKSGAAARRERNRQEMRSAILDTARQIIADGGAEELTIRSVAQRLGYSPGALYEYFTSKEEMLKALYFESQGGLGTFCEQVVRDLPAGTNAVEALTALGQAYRDHALSHAELYRMVFSEFKSPPEPDEETDLDNAAGGFGGARPYRQARDRRRRLRRSATAGPRLRCLVGRPRLRLVGAEWSDHRRPRSRLPATDTGGGQAAARSAVRHRRANGGHRSLTSGVPDRLRPPKTAAAAPVVTHHKRHPFVGS